MLVRLLLLAVLALGIAPAAQAATVSIVPKPPGADAAELFTGPFVAYTAADGERNRLRVTFEDRRWVLTDPGATITIATSECTLLDEHTASCAPNEPDGEVRQIKADLGDEDDTLQGARGVIVPAVFADGGSGDDRLTGGDTYDELIGGGGTDRLDGGDEDDRLIDGDRRARRDVLVGGPGTDTVDYAGRRSDVRVDLRRRTAGARGREDRTVSVERAAGGSGDDVLIGTADEEAELLAGGPGDDVLLGGGGERGDVLEGGPGDDRLGGGSGGDLFEPGTGRDRLECASGDDEVFEADGLDHVPGGCEAVIYYAQYSEFAYTPGPDRVRGDVLTWNTGCAPPEEPGDPLETGCEGTMEVRERGGKRRLLASGAITGSGPESSWPETTDLRLTALGQTTIRREPLAVMGISGRNLPTASWVFRFDRD